MDLHFKMKLMVQRLLSSNPLRDSCKKLHKHYSDKIVASDLNLKNDITKASSNPVLSKSVVRRPSLLIQTVSPVAQGILSSPAQILEKHAEKTWSRSPKFPKVTSAARLFHRAPQIIGETNVGHSEILGPRHEHRGTFSAKRANLLQLAAGTRSQNVDDFLLNRSHFIFEILERLGLSRDSNKTITRQHAKLQKTRDHPFTASSERSGRIFEFCDTLQENRRTFEPRQYVNLLTWDDSKTLPFPCKHSSPKACFENSLWKPAETLLPDFNLPASPFEFMDEFDATEVKFFQTDSSAYMGKPYRNSHFSSAPDHESLHEFCITRNPTNTWNSNVEIDPIKSQDSFRALVPCINESSAGLRMPFPLLERDATEHELPEHNCFVPKVDHFPTFLHDIFGFWDEIGRSSSADVCRRRGLSSLQSCSFDIMLPGVTCPMKLDVGNYRSPTPASSMYFDFHLSAANQSVCKNDIDFVGAPSDFPINITVLGRDDDFEFSHGRFSY